MSLPNKASCLKCGKTKDEGELKPCRYHCDAFYCSDVCQDEDEESHEMPCSHMYRHFFGKINMVSQHRIETVLELAIVRNNYQLLKWAVEVIETSFSKSSKLLDTPALICFFIELGIVSFLILFSIVLKCNFRGH